MKRINRKGFTLIELMAVIAILVIIMGIALPNITSSIERSKNKEKDIKIKLVESAGELYLDGHPTCTAVNIDALLTADNVPGVEKKDVCDDTSNCCVKKISSKYEISGECTNACPQT